MLLSNVSDRQHELSQMLISWTTLTLKRVHVIISLPWKVKQTCFLTSKSVSSGNSGAIRAIGPSMSGEEASVSWATITCCLGFLGGELLPNPRVTLVPVAWWTLQHISARYRYCTSFPRLSNHLLTSWWAIAIIIVVSKVVTITKSFRLIY